MSKKAVIATGGKQYIVTEGETIEVERLKNAKDILTINPLLIIDGDAIMVGAPEVSGASVTAKVLEEVKADKVTSIRYKSKKRVHKVRGHRQLMTLLSIDKISLK